MEKGRRTWAWVQAKPSCVPQAVKEDLSRRAGAFIDLDLKPKHVTPPPGNPKFNYIVDIATKWHGRFFYFVAKYACPGPNAMSPFFEVGFVRIEYQRNGLFCMAYMRHTGQWWQLYTDLTLDDALEIIRNNMLFQP